MIKTRSARPSALLVVTVFLVIILVAIFAISYLRSHRKFTEAVHTHIDISIDGGGSLRTSFVGDSMTYGLFATEQPRGFHELMVAQWRNSGPSSDYSVNTVGGTVAGTLTRNDFPTDQQLYVVELGTNDAARVDYTSFRNDYRRLLERIRESSPDTQILCMGVWRPKQVADIYDTVIRDLCEAQGGVFRSISDLSVNTRLKGPSGTPTFAGASDSFHPNDLGHRMIADRMLKAITVERTG